MWLKAAQLQGLTPTFPYDIITMAGVVESKFADSHSLPADVSKTPVKMELQLYNNSIEVSFY